MSTSLRQPLYRHLAGLVDAYRRVCTPEFHRPEWVIRHAERIKALAAEHLPRGSGVDYGTEVDLVRSTGKRLVLHLSFHHMNDAGMYDGWTEHEAIVTPSLMFGIDVRVTGRDRNGIKDYLAEELEIALKKEVE